MPTYLYAELRDDGSEGEPFEVTQSMTAPVLTHHPETGRPVHRVYVAPHLSVRYSAGSTAKRLDNRNVERAGFTKYERDKLTGKYHKVAGANPDAPAVLNRPPA